MMTSASTVPGGAARAAGALINFGDDTSGFYDRGLLSR